MKLTVSHRITTKFDPVQRRLVQSHRLFPSDCASQTATSWQVIAGDSQVGAEFYDGAGDQTATISTPGEVTEQTIEIVGEIETTDTLGVLRGLKEKVPAMAYLTPTRLTRPDAAITALAKEGVAGITTDLALDRAHGLAKAVTAALTETDEMSETMSTATEILEEGKGGQSEYAHLLIAAAQSVEIPARFVYGYFVSDAVDFQTELDEDAYSGAFVMSSWPGHAWAELWVEDLGWVGFDAVQECCPDERYIRLCSGRDAVDAAPLRATSIGQGAETFEVSLDVRAAEQ